ncbi:hypothetical protein ACFPYN_13960 [Paenisporosarcina macmurdoensis]|uniref:Uncharacterized protein n=1 Tax=Paenisporosarcina macmurdoensis TaxID=212659 RepID=A0ABW1LBD0_9BACL
MYGERRKRNIDMSRFERSDQTLSIFKDKNEEVNDEFQVEDDEYEYEEITVDLEEELEEELEEKINEEQLAKDPQQLYIDGKPFVPKQKKRKLSFEESHIRITTYLSVDNHLIVRMLLKQNQITSITALINDSVKAYLLSEFSDDTNQ